MHAVTTMTEAESLKEARRWRLEPQGREQFVGSGWAPSMMVVQSDQGAKIFTARDGMPK